MSDTYIIGTLTDGHPSWAYHKSIRNLMHHDLLNKQRLRGFTDHECGAGRITDARNDAVRAFLKTGADWLVFIDSDMGFDADAVDRLIDSAHEEGTYIMGGLAFGMRRDGVGPQNSMKLEQFPTIYRWVETPTAVGCAPVYDYPRDSVVECDGTGAAFFAVHRFALAEMELAFKDSARPWFHEAEIKGRFFGEDLSFFKRAKDLGFGVYVNTAVKTSHHKTAYLTEGSQPQLADIPNYVVIPVKIDTFEQLEMTEHLVQELAYQGECAKIFVFDNGSSLPLGSIRESGGIILAASGKNIHEMWNRGLEKASAESNLSNVVILNNDITIDGPTFVSSLVHPLRHDPLVGATCANYDARAGTGTQYTEDMCAGRYDGTGGFAGFAFALKGETGYRFPKNLQWYFGDNDLFTSVHYAGGKTAIALDAKCTHIDGGSKTGDWESMRAVLEHDQKVFEEKWPEVKIRG
jgi:GT2 family glycosyltransferase